MKDLVIYHKNCLDGFGSAFAFWHRYGSTLEYFPGVYNRPPPFELIENNTVYLVDFSYKRDMMLNIAKYAGKVVILDHHETAMLDLIGIEEEAADSEDYCTVESNFNMDLSGAVISWKYVYKDEAIPVPELFMYIQDRDLWKWKFAETRPVTLALRQKPFDFNEWERAIGGVDSLLAKGETLVEYNEKLMEDIIRASKRDIVIGGYEVPVCNSPPHFASDIGNKMSVDQPFAATYYDIGTDRLFSLRSQKDGIHVGDIALIYGGGGHPNAAGFSVERTHVLATV